ncbi:hypothetical protein [Flavobacterium sp. N1994]|uniref:hypothetical protein n=1 Tax=Flavobacterium sp. N1994 TaxID=2986827 RepID=UPI00222280FE|nr:hypothetical protein [Flavobacterium sp. N1994]
MTTTTKRQPIAYNGSGSAIDNYMKPQPEQVQKVENWASFTKLKPDPKKRKVLFSLLHQAQWTKPNAKYGEVPNLERLSDFLKSDKSPVQKKLIDMEIVEMEKIIKAFKGIVKSTWK